VARVELAVTPGDTQYKLTLLTLLRFLIAAVLLLAIFVFGGSKELAALPGSGRELLYSAVTGLLIMCAVTAALLERWKDGKRLTLLAYGHFVGDALFATALILLTGGSDSVFTFLYSLAIINASIVLYRKGALFTAGANAFCLIFVAWGQVSALETPVRSLLESGAAFGYPTGLEQSWRDLIPGLSVNLLAFCGMAFLSSFLAEQMQSADEQARRHKLKLEELALLHQNIVSSLDSGMITLDPDRRVTTVNPAGCLMVGRLQPEILSRRIEELFPDLGPVLDNPDKITSSHSETTTLQVAGKTVHIRWSISPLRDREMNHVGHVLLFFDVSRLKEMEAVVERSERMAALGRLAANIAHEIRNPLASMSGSIQLLADTLEVQGADKRLMDIVVREAEHLSGWIGEFLEYARHREPVHEPVDLTVLAHEIVAILRNDPMAADVEITYQGGPSCTLEGDSRQLNQVIWNLALNAVEAASPGGRVTVETSSSGENVGLRITDTGPGIQPGLIPRIFEPFFTTKSGGTGLGLATVHKNVEQHGGTVEVRPLSEAGKGAAFLVTLPRRQRKTAPATDDRGLRRE
jgi:two-component system sensor histidine kinase PilS (NtrC family)